MVVVHVAFSISNNNISISTACVLVLVLILYLFKTFHVFIANYYVLIIVRTKKEPLLGKKDKILNCNIVADCVCSLSMR